MPNVIAPRRGPAIAQATLRDSDPAPLPGKAINFYVQKAAAAGSIYAFIGSAQTNASGVASIRVPDKYVSALPRTMRAVFQGDSDYGGSEATAQISRAK